MSRREVLIVLAHAQACDTCRQRLLQAPETILKGRSLSDAEQKGLMSLTEAQFASKGALSTALGVTVAELDQYSDHPVVRLRHF